MSARPELMCENSITLHKSRVLLVSYCEVAAIITFTDARRLLD